METEPILCYVEDQWAFFTYQALTEQRGDDWNDAPYEHNAGDPYGDIVKVAFTTGYSYLLQPRDNHLNSPYSVEEINKGAVPWLRDHDEQKFIMAGATFSEFKAFILNCGGEIYEKTAAATP